mmetsp:Transcript_2415/g.3569  ORF Transcript_2415/g.3569 Transcript_2415/m.3569 type:complete len:435 (-) Transcript_2415:11-1315(-)
MYLTLFLSLSSLNDASAFSTNPQDLKRSCYSTAFNAAPRRLKENAEGVVYVNEKCINCATCSNFAPTVFRRSTDHYAHIVYHQPSKEDEISDARAAMVACPVAAIRSETLAQRRHGAEDKEAVKNSWTTQDDYLVQQMALNPTVNGRKLPFPRPLLHHDAATKTTTSTIPSGDEKSANSISNVFNVGYHNEESFGATPYLMKAKVDGNFVWIMVDSPRYGKAALDAVTLITGPEGPSYLFLTHVDDTAGHEKWAEEFPKMKRIFHLGDGGSHNWVGDRSLETDVEILLPPPEGSSPPDDDEEATPFHAYHMDGTSLSKGWYQDFLEDASNEVVILHTPGHSPGSITLLKKASSNVPGIIFTGDHYAYSTRTSRMSGFPRYGNNLSLQAKSLERLLHIEWDVVAPGHGHPRDYSGELDKQELRRKEMKEAIQDLH